MCGSVQPVAVAEPGLTAKMVLQYVPPPSHFQAFLTQKHCGAAVVLQTIKAAIGTR
jgi:hypothetical protein